MSEKILTNELKATHFECAKVDHSRRKNKMLPFTGEDHLLLGSFVQANCGDRHVTMSSPYVQSMLKQCKELCPRLQALNDSDFQLTVGIRPGREKVRLEQDPDEPCIFHNYGHYRWGMTLNWGSAADIVKLIDREVTKTSRRTTKNRLGLAKL